MTYVVFGLRYVLNSALLGPGQRPVILSSSLYWKKLGLEKKGEMDRSCAYNHMLLQLPHALLKKIPMNLASLR